MYSEIAIKVLAIYVKCVSANLEIASILLAFASGLSVDYMKFFAAIALKFLQKVIFAFNMAILCAQLDSDLLDYDDNATNSGFHYPLNRNVRIDMFQNDDEADQFTLFKKNELLRLLDIFGLPEYIWVPQNSVQITGKYYLFHREELLIYMLHRMVSKSTHKAVADSPLFGGSSNRWSKGYRWLVMHLDDRYFPLIGPDGVRMWVAHFPSFAHTIWDYLAKPKRRYYGDANQHFRCVQWNHPGAPGRDELNIAAFMDCKTYSSCRPGSGPYGDYDDAPRRPFAYIIQRAFYDGHHKKHAIKILTIYLPNGMTAAVYGPTSARGKDPSLLEWSDFDTAIRDECLNHFHNRLYAVYADSIFKGYWHCLRTRHEEIPQLGIHLTFAQENENNNLKSARVAIEFGYGRASQLFPLLEVREYTKLLLDADLIYAQMRVMHFLSNVVTCLREGSTCTGKRMFACPPPSLEEYLRGMQ